jgi:excisionase family DNA binding protein
MKGECGVKTYGRLLTVEDAAEHMSTSVRFVRRLIAERRIEFVRIGRHVRISESALAEFIAAGRVEPLISVGIRSRVRGVALWLTKVGIAVSATFGGCLLAGIRSASRDRMAGFGRVRRHTSARPTPIGLSFLSKPS